MIRTELSLVVRNVHPLPYVHWSTDAVRSCLKLRVPLCLIDAAKIAPLALDAGGASFPGETSEG